LSNFLFTDDRLSTSRLTTGCRDWFKKQQKYTDQPFKTRNVRNKEKDLKMEKLPDIEFHTSYNQVTNLFQHQNGVFQKATKYDVINGMYDFTLSASIPVYMGGKIKNTEKKAAIDTEISALKPIWMKDSLKWRSLPLFFRSII
jgi:hypothetical protein